MSATILLKRSSTASAVPADLQEGELACNTADGKLFLGTGSTVLDVTAGSGMTNPMTASGDIIYGGTSGTPTRLAKGTDGQVLTLASGLPAWAAVSGGSLLVAETVVSGSAVTSVEFSGLDGNTAGGYVLTVSIKQVSGDGLLRITCNDVASGSYRRQYCAWTGAAASGASDTNAPFCAYTANNTTTDTYVSFESANSTFHICFQYADNVSGSYGFAIGQAYLLTQANLTKITLTNTITNGIGVGSTFRLYKRK